MTSGNYSSGTEQSYSWYELRAIYATDHGSGARIEQILEGTAPTEADKTTLKQIIADATGRLAYEIDLEIIASSEREHVEDTAIVRQGRIRLGGV